MVSKIILPKPRGFCAGVDRAIEAVEKTLELFGKPVYVRHEIVHNQHVVKDLEKKGAVFVEELKDVPKGCVVVFSAHGVAPQVKKEAEQLGLKAIDATCPLVTKVHLEAIRFHRDGYKIILIGHKGHQEVIGTMGEAPMVLVESVEDVEKLNLKKFDKAVYLTQTTLSVDETKDIIKTLRKKFPQIEEPPKEDICYATTNRQEAVKQLAKKADLILVVGAFNSSNSNRMVEVAKACGVPAFLVPDKSHIKKEWFDVDVLGLTSGASAPETLVNQIVEYVKELYPKVKVEEADYVKEEMFFPLPRELRN